MWYFNLEAIKCLRYVFRNRSLIIPHLEVDSIKSIDFRQLHNKGFRGIIFDKDNTLTEHYGKTIHEPYKASIDTCKEIFGEENVVIISNSAGSSDDYPEYKSANSIEKSMGIKVLKHNTKKPDGINAVMSHFNTDPSNLIMVGDRYLTDVLFGNLYGMLTICIKPLSPKSESGFITFLRDKERIITSYLKHTWGVKAPKNKNWDI